MNTYGGNGFSVGDRVELSPACDLWMRGARFGVVVGKSITKADRYKIELDKILGRKFSCSEDLLRLVD
jgi:hypothetical protein